ncbi:OmpA family protein [Nesterenkonia alba]|uniref:OmpA family protein n=1 Tax=Nesterenkonia alba TaxID=515814 RepID=UPI0003B3A704|nr:OmpA family protein [Nesterenkonia alba]
MMRWVQWQRSAALFCVGAVALAGCAPSDTEEDTADQGETRTEESDQDTGDEAEESPDTEGEAEKDSADESDADEEGMTAADGYWRPAVFPEPIATTEVSARTEDGLAEAQLEVLSLDREGDTARLVLAWTPPQDAEAFLGAADALPHPSRGGRGFEAERNAPRVALVDHSSDEVLEPLWVEQDEFDPEASPEREDFPEAEVDAMDYECACARASLRTEAHAGEEPESVELIYLDFPAPEGDEVDVLPGRWIEPVPSVPVSDSEPLELPEDETYTITVGVDETLDQLPEEYGAGGRYERRLDLTARSETAEGVNTIEDEDSQQMSVPADVLFDFGSDELDSEAHSIIEDAAEILNDEAAGQTVTVEGHTDNVGGEELNQDLSERRAEAVAEVLTDHLDSGIELETEGHAFHRPLVPNTDAEGNDIEENQALNRRVSFRYEPSEERSEHRIETGQEAEEIPEAEETDTAEGAEASFLIDHPDSDENGDDPQVRLDLLQVERDDDLVTLRVAYAHPEGTDETVFDGLFSAHFGPTPYGGGPVDPPTPNMVNASVLDLEAGEIHHPVTGGTDHCLCTGFSPSGSELFADPVPMYAQFRFPEDLSEDLELRIGEVARLPLPESLTDELSGS